VKIKLAPEQRHDPAFDSLQVTKIIILSNTEGNPEDRTLSAEITAIPVAEPIPGHLIYAKSQTRTIKIPDLWAYLVANPAIGGALLTALAATIADQVTEWSSAVLEVGE
jgi:hypothetical protein